MITTAGGRGQLFYLETGGPPFPGGQVANGGKGMLCVEVGMRVSMFQRRGGRQH